MQTQLKKTDFLKVKRFIDAETKKAKKHLPVVTETSSTDLSIGTYHITYSDGVWFVNDSKKVMEFNNKRNAMYYAFLMLYNNTHLIPELLALDNRLGNTLSEVEVCKHCLKHAGRDNFKIGLYHNKLSEAVARYKKARTDMHNWMDCAKYIN